jgi:hypothetical protein
MYVYPHISYYMFIRIYQYLYTYILIHIHIYIYMDEDICTSETMLLRRELECSLKFEAELIIREYGVGLMMMVVMITIIINN